MAAMVADNNPAPFRRTNLHEATVWDPGPSGILSLSFHARPAHPWPWHYEIV